MRVHVYVKMFTCMRAFLCVRLHGCSYVFGGCVESAYAFMSVVGVYVSVCVRIAVCAYVNFASNVTHIYSKLVA